VCGVYGISGDAEDLVDDIINRSTGTRSISDIKSSLVFADLQVSAQVKVIQRQSFG